MAVRTDATTNSTELKNDQLTHLNLMVNRLLDCCWELHVIYHMQYQWHANAAQHAPSVCEYFVCLSNKSTWHICLILTPAADCTTRCWLLSAIM
jgi:hypothetical protein